MSTQNYTALMNRSLLGLFSEALSLAVRDMSRIPFVVKTIFRQRKAVRIRHIREKQGLHVPPYMLISVTSACNLRCKGCYAQSHARAGQKEMSAEKLRGIVADAQELGTSVVVFVGGEPFLRPGLLEITAEFPRLIFPVFTNGLLLSDERLQQLQRQKHVIPLISIEGLGAETDSRRGDGVYQHLEGTFGRLTARNIFWGASITVSNANFDQATGDAFVGELRKAGCRLFFFVEYTPIEPGTEHLVLSGDRRQALERRVAALKSRYPALYVSFPGDEKAYGGCLAAGRGFIHVSASGDVEPCPFSPYSDTSLATASLKDALSSPLLKAIRDNHVELAETGGCALYQKREWVQSLLSKPQPSK